MSKVAGAVVPAEYAPDALVNLRESFALHLDATRARRRPRASTWTRSTV